MATEGCLVRGVGAQDDRRESEPREGLHVATGGDAR
jgi:hypothetical protein